MVGRSISSMGDSGPPGLDHLHANDSLVAMRRLVAVLISCVATTFVWCGGSSSDSSPSRACVPGASVACTGARACAGNQVCKDDGSGYSPCICADAGVTDAGGPQDSSAAGDSASGADADAGSSPGAFIRNLPGLVLWLDDDVGVDTDPQNAAHVITWHDQSGNGNDAIATDGTINVYPTTPLKDHRALGCNPGHFVVTSGTQMEFGSGDFDVTVVAQCLIGGKPWSKWGSGLGLYVVFDVPIKFFVGTTAAVTSTSSNVGGFHIFTLRGRTLELRVDGQSHFGLVNTTDVSAPGNPALLGLGNCEIAEVVAIKGQLSSPDLAVLESYLKTKFGL